MSDRQFDPDSLRDGVATAGQPPAPASELPEDAYEVEVLRTIADGTQLLTSARALGRYPGELESLSFPKAGGPLVATLSPRDAAMAGLSRLIQGLRWFSFNLEDLMSGNAGATVTAHTLGRVFLDWPDERKESMPTQTALITSAERATYGSVGFQARLLEDTEDRFAPGTMLRYLGEVQIPLLLYSWCAHKDQRRGLEARISQLLAAERHTDDQGRRIILPEYFSRIIRYSLIDTERPDDATAARGNEWTLAVTVQAEVEIVELVRSPGHVESTGIDVEADPGSAPESGG